MALEIGRMRIPVIMKNKGTQGPVANTIPCLNNESTPVVTKLPDGNECRNTTIKHATTLTI